MTTGVDCKTCKLIVLDSNIGSMIEFKQIIGRGTRIKEDHGKMFFTIMDFRDVCRLFADPEFDGDPIPVDAGEERDGDTPPDGDEIDNEKLPTPRIKYRVNDVEVVILNERLQYYDKDGKLILESVTDYSKKNILGEFPTLDDFLTAWNSSERKQAIIDELKERGVLIETLREASGNRDIDDFDLICHIAFDKKSLSRRERADNVKKRDYLNKYEGLARDVLSALLDKYSSVGIGDLDEIQVLTIAPFRDLGSTKSIVEAFGDREQYRHAVKSLWDELYKTAV
jgi:type I restriction enzyme R subunit